MSSNSAEDAPPAQAVKADAQTDAKDNKKNDVRARWPALESNPEALTAFIRKLGVPASIKVHDVYGFDPELLMMIPQPVYAMILLFPCEMRTEERAKRDDCADRAKYDTGTVLGS